MDRLRRTHLLHDLSGTVHLTMYDAMQVLAPGPTAASHALPRCDTAMR